MSPGYCEPFIKRNPDGLVLVTSTKEYLWLTFWQRIQYFFGFTSAHKLDHEYLMKRSEESAKRRHAKDKQ